MKLMSGDALIADWIGDMTKMKVGLTLVMFALPLFGQIALEGPPKIEAPKIEVGANPLADTNPSTISMQ